MTRNSISFKSISLTLVAAHIFCFILKDAVFAQSSSTAAKSSPAQKQANVSVPKKSSEVNYTNKDSKNQPPADSNNKTAPNRLTSSSIPPVSVTGVSGFNLAALQSFQNDPFTGRAAFSVPITVPEARKGIQPNISLNYSSGAPNGILGVGWSLELGSIERSTKKGPPKYDSSDAFIFNSSSQAELISIGSGQYRPKIEGAFMKFEFDGTYWLATDKAGTKYYFGQSASSRQESGSNVFRWCLDKVVDIHGNYMLISYSLDQGQIYPAQIQYGGNEAGEIANSFSVYFLYEDRPDQMINYRTAWRIIAAKRLSEVKVSASGVFQRIYRLGYSAYGASEKSLLNSVTQYSGDGSMSLPAITFEYSQEQAGWDLSARTLPQDHGNFDWTTTILDVNNDGYSDIITNNGQSTYLGRPDGSWEEVSVWRFPSSNFTNGHGDCGWRFADINGDGWVDVICHTHTDGGTRAPEVYLNNKTNGWVYDAEWSARFPCEAYFVYNHHNEYEWHEIMGWMLSDINSDGLIDIIRSRGDGHEFYLNTGSGWQLDATYNTPTDTDFTDGSTQISDVNADGLPDLFVAKSERKTIYLNTGRGWVREQAIEPPNDPDMSFAGGTTQSVDVNSDGLSDVLIAKSSQRRAFINKGKLNGAWQENNNFALPAGEFDNNATRLADTKAKYLLDLLINSSSSENKIYLNRNTNLATYLTKVNNGLGGSVSVTYKPSTQFTNTGSDGISDLPFPVYVVDTVTTHDSLNIENPDIIARYEYKDGMFDFVQREFRGFGYAKAIDADDNYSETYFKQDDIFKGRPYLQQSKDIDANLYAKSENLWQERELYSGVHFVYLRQADNFIYDAQATCKQTRIKYEYDDYGNPSKVESLGDMDTTGDEKTQITEYTYNTSNWILSSPKHIYLQDSQGVKVSEKWFYYDNHNSFNDPPDKGLLTKEEVYLYDPITGQGKNISSGYAYNEYGNLISTTDALGRVTATTYDSVYQIFPVQVTNALSHSVKSVYYGVNELVADPISGFGLFGQLKCSEDTNNQKTWVIYDKLGRKSKSIGPYDEESTPAVIYSYQLDTLPAMVSVRTKVNYPDIYLNSHIFYDGLGKALEAKSPAEDEPQTGRRRQIISEIAKYNNKGQLKEKYLPYFIYDSGDSFEPINYSSPHNSIDYDPAGRIVKIANADATNSTASYLHWKKTLTDENGHTKSQYYDAYSRIIKVEENNNGQVYTTRYSYDTLGNLIELVDNQNNLTKITYDSLGRKLRMEDLDMGTWRYEYDDAGNLIKQTDAKGQVLEFQYDSLNRLTKKDGRASQGATALSLAAYVYDDSSRQYSNGRLSKVIDQSGYCDFFYDKQGREVKSAKYVSGQGTFTVERAYDAADRIISLKYPDGYRLNYEYSAQGVNSLRGVAASAEEETFVSDIQYQATGQMIKIFYGNGTDTTYAYDPNTMRLSSIITESPQGRIQDLNYSFDNSGNIRVINDYLHSSAQSFTYDNLDRLIRAQGPYGDLSYNYDSIGNMLDKEGAVLTYGKQGKLPHAVTAYTKEGLTYSYDYDLNGNLKEKHLLANQDQYSLFSYDLENRLTRVESKQSLQPQQIKLTLAPGWNFISLPALPEDKTIASIFSSVLSQIEQISRYDVKEKKFQSYCNNAKFDEFNSLEELKGYQVYLKATGAQEISLTVSATLPKQQSIALKAGYNLVACPSVTETAVEEALSSLKINLDYSKVLYYNKTTNSFLEYSNTKKDFKTLKPGVAYYIYCLKDTIWAVSNDNTSLTTFVYDGDGGRVKKTQATAINSDKQQQTVYIGSLFEITNTTVTKHIFAGANRIASIESNLVNLTAKAGLTDSTIQTSSTNYFHSDHLGSSNCITDKDGKQLCYIEFVPYGSTFRNTGLSTQGTVPIKYLFTGKELDSTGLYYYGARYYDPVIGRFITADTIVQAPYDPQSLNRYSYCRNNPINYVDPTGHSWFSKFFKNLWKSITDNPVAFVVGLVAGIGVGMLAANFVAPAMASWFTAGGKVALTAAQNAIITGTEFGLGGFASGFAGTLAGGSSFSDAFKAGGIGFGVGFGIGGLAGYTYATGFQDFIHGFDSRAFNQNIFVNQVGQGNYAGATRTLSVDNTLKVRVSGAKVHFTGDGGISGINPLEGGSGVINASKDGFTYLADLLPGYDNPSFTANTLELKNLLTNQIDPSKATSFVGLNAKNLPITMQTKYTAGWMRYEYLHPGSINLTNTQVYGYYPNNIQGHVTYIKDVLSSNK